MREPAVNNQNPILTKTENVIFLSRWLQAPMYFGLIVGLAVYGFKFMRSCSTSSSAPRA